METNTVAEHVASEHKNSALVDYFKEIIYGGIDGIVTTFAVVAGFSGAALSGDTMTQMSFLVVLLFGLANLFADAASMGLGNFLSVRSEKDLYFAARDKEVDAVRNSAHSEFNETVAIMKEKGFSDEQAHTLAEIYKTNEDYWVDFMMQHELEMSDPRGENEVFTGLATFISFMIFGAIPLLPFILQSEGDARVAFILSSLGTFVALVMLGLLKWRVIGAKLMSSLFEVVTVGSVAAVLAFLVGTFFSI
ncbi:GMP synthase [bacterium]|nr:GMP synthase [bacterium]